MRIRVKDVLDMLAGGAAQAETSKSGDKSSFPTTIVI
jgi:hypothetical protein